MKWLRLYHELLYDRKIARISRTEQLPKSTVLGAWIGILILASESPVRGELMLSEGIPLDTEEIGDAIGLYDSDLDYLLGAFISCNMLTNNDGYFRINNWNKRQYKSDDSTERVKRFREKQVKQPDETLPKRYSNALDTDTDTDKETEEDKTITSASADYQLIRSAWIPLFPKKSKPRDDNKTLIGKVKTRMQSEHFRDSWQTAMARAAQSDFLIDSSWFDLGWFLKNDDNYEKCLNGKYANSMGKETAPGIWSAAEEIYEEEQWQHSKT